MFDSKSVASSSRGPLWVAAYCFKRLKKAQVFETDISSSVDKILRDEMDVVSYRVLAYLLLGIVRIYSKKVEYLFHDCNEVLSSIKKFFINTKNTALFETLCMSISIPERFELDAFDLGILEDDEGDHTAPREDITLKDALCETEGFGQHSLDKFQFEEFGFCQCTSSANHLVVEDARQSHLMDIDFEVLSPDSPINLQTGKDNFENSILFQVESVNIDNVFEDEGVHTECENLFSQGQQTNEDQTVPENATSENKIPEERSIISREESVNIRIYSRRKKEPINESPQVNEEHILTKETSSTYCQIHQEIKDVHEAENIQGSMERPQDDISYKKECMDHKRASVAKENLEVIESSVEEQDKECKSDFQEKVTIEDGKCNVILPHLDVTPQSKFRDDSVGRPKPGATTPESTLIPTPAVREHARFSRKRKCVIDGLTILPNEVLRKTIHDASDLISNRRKFRHIVLARKRQSPIVTLPDGFYESLLPRYSSELRFLFSKRKLNISDSLQILEIPGKLDESESQIVGRPEHQATAPETPPQSPKAKIRSVEHPESTEKKTSDNLEPSSLHESIQRERCFKRDEELNLMEEFTVGTSSSYGSLERERCLTKNDDLNLLNEENIETENSELLAGWSERTRKVARYLHRSFLDQRKQREEEVVKLSQVLGGRLRKECARLFYEILVLKTTSFVDVKQENAYGDISVLKLVKLDRSLGI